MRWRYEEDNRIGDHICYYSDLRKLRRHYPDWRMMRPLESIVEEIARSWADRLSE
jgi:CDP-paratose 2-epimerase